MSERLNILDLASQLSDKTGKDKKNSELFIREFISIVSETLPNDKIVKVKGLGSFKVITIEQRESVDVNTGERILIPSHSRISFVPEKELKERINKPFACFETVELGDDISFSDVGQSTEKKNVESTEEVEVVEEVTNEETSEINEEQKTEDALPEVPAEEVTELKSEEQETSEEVEQPNGVSDEKQKKSSSNLTAIILVLLFVLFCLGVYSFYTGGFWIAERTNVEEQVKPAETIEESFQPVDDATETVQEQLDANTTNDIKEKEIVKETIVSGTRLTLISLKHYGHKVFWVYIYEHNKDVIKNPNNIQIGTEIVIPDAALYNIDVDNPKSIEKAEALQIELSSRF